jgi:hypothetical protein
VELASGYVDGPARGNSLDEPSMKGEDAGVGCSYWTGAAPDWLGCCSSDGDDKAFLSLPGMDFSSVTIIDREVDGARRKRAL